MKLGLAALLVGCAATPVSEIELRSGAVAPTIAPSLGDAYEPFIDKRTPAVTSARAQCDRIEANVPICDDVPFNPACPARVAEVRDAVARCRELAEELP